MQINHIHVENYKTYLNLDLDISVKSEDRPILLIGGMNGSGKTTLFDAIYSALYGLNINGEAHFRELFNSGVQRANELYLKWSLKVSLQTRLQNISFAGLTKYSMARRWKTLPFT